MLLRGSTWSRWDLHIHTPCSIHNGYSGNNNETWDKFIEHLENLPSDVDVIGINDYYFIDGFERVMDYKMNKGRLSNIKKIFPIIEFRIDTFATASESKLQKVNLHVLFKIDEANWKREIEKIKKEFIERINVSVQHPTKPLSPESFIEIAGNLKSGFDNYVPPTNKLFEIIESEAWKDRVMVLLGYKEWNNLEKGGQLKPYKQELFNKADALFTASADDDVTKKESILSEFGGNVIIHSMDIHNFSDLQNENYRCFTWIKADKTFEGLKQIIFEPTERIKIQQNNPFYDEQKSVVIDSLKINNSNNWFSEEEIPLNSGLVTIIGEKGAGKTALLDLMAIANNEGIYEPDKVNPYSFYNRAKNEIINTEVEIGYLGGANKSVYKLDGAVAKSKSNNHAVVRYLSLKELESYVDQKDKFQAFIKNIIHIKSPELSGYEDKVNKFINKIQELSRELSELESKIANFKYLEDAYDNKKSELNLHILNEPKIKTNFIAEQEDEYKKLITNEQEINSLIQKNRQASNNIIELGSWIVDEVKVLKEQFSNQLKIKINQLNNVDKSIFNEVDINIEILGKSVVQNEIDRLYVQNEDLAKNLLILKDEIEPLEELNKNFISEQKITRAWIERKNLLEEELEQLELRKKSLEMYKEQIVVLQKQRKGIYTQVLETKVEQKLKYEELKVDLESDENIGFKVKIEFDFCEFLEKESAIINHGSGNSKDVIKEKLETKILDQVKKVDGTSKEELSSITGFIDLVDDENFIGEVFGENKTKDNLLKKSFSILDYYNWLFDDYFAVNYFIEYKGRALETLSPGQKGLVLMKVFLRLDNSSKPLLIDQPEDNLDNKSVYNDLVNDFREIKKKRQIIIATHNPNLVVNTDSEQVIVARFVDTDDCTNPKIIYSSGSLENNEIRNEVCDILEGGNTAFKKREKRYSLK